MARLPQPGGDSGNWGDILNDYLSQALKADGQIKDNAVTANTLAPNSVTNAALANDSVNASIIADNSISEVLLNIDVRTKLNAPPNIADGSVALVKLSSTVQASLAKADSALQSAPVTKVNDKTGDVVLVKSDIGLGNVDNTNDADKPVSTLAHQALNTKISKVASSDEAMVRFDGATGAVQNSGVTVDDSNNVTVPGSLAVNNDLLYVDSTVKRVGVGTNQPDAKLKVVSTNSDPGLTISASGGRILQAQVAGATKFFIDGSGFFRIGSLAAQPAGVIHVDMATAGNLSDSMIGMTVRGRAAQTGDLLQLQDSNSNVMFGVDSTGKARMTGAPTSPTHVTNKQYVDSAAAATVTSVSATGTQGVAASVTNATTTPAISIGLGAITPTSMTTAGTSQSLQHVATNGTFTTTLASNNLSFNRAGASYIDQSAATGSIIIRTRDTAGTGDLNRMTFTSGNSSAIQVSNANLNLSEGVNVDVGTTTGSKIGTTTTQKIGFFGATPIVQPSSTTDLGTVLSNLGLRASGTGYSLAMSGSFASAGSVRSGSTTSSTTTTLTTASVEYQLCNAATAGYTVTLPSTATAGYRFTIKKIDGTANVVTIAGTIDGASNYTLATQYKFVTLISSTTSGTWYVVGGN